eukprot:scaffold10943_cov102-Isochrysis_galbana.AAC.3
MSASSRRFSSAASSARRASYTFSHAGEASSPSCTTGTVLRSASQAEEPADTLPFPLLESTRSSRRDGTRPLLLTAAGPRGACATVEASPPRPSASSDRSDWAADDEKDEMPLKR